MNSGIDAIVEAEGDEAELVARAFVVIAGPRGNDLCPCESCSFWVARLSTAALRPTCECVFASEMPAEPGRVPSTLRRLRAEEADGGSACRFKFSELFSF